jgi:hypothetical protein
MNVLLEYYYQPSGSACNFLAVVAVASGQMVTTSHIVLLHFCDKMQRRDCLAEKPSCRTNLFSVAYNLTRCLACAVNFNFQCSTKDLKIRILRKVTQQLIA